MEIRGKLPLQAGEGVAMYPGVVLTWPTELLWKRAATFGENVDRRRSETVFERFTEHEHLWPVEGAP